MIETASSKLSGHEVNTALSNRLGVWRQRFDDAAREVFINHNESPDFQKVLDSVAGSTSSKYQATLYSLQLLNIISPSILKNVIRARYKYTQDNLPFDPKTYYLEKRLGGGGNNNVLLFESLVPDFNSFVFKTNHFSHFSKNKSELIELALKERAEYERINTDFSAIPGLIPIEHYLITHAPVKEKTISLSMIQPFVGTNIQDIFKVSASHLCKELTDNPKLASDVNAFVITFKSHPEYIEEELDILGKDNLVLANDNGVSKLILLDPHFRSKSHRRIETKNEINNRIAYLSSLLNRRN